MSGKKGRGRPRKVSTLINESLEIVDQNLPAIFQSLVTKAIQGDREAQIYLIDRRLGKPKQQSEVDIKGGADIGINTIMRIHTLIDERNKELDYAVQRPELSEGTSETEEAETAPGCDIGCDK